MSNFKVGNSKFSRFVNGKGFYIALAICLVAIGTAAYIAVNNSAGLIDNIKNGSGVSASNFSPASSVPNWDSAAQTANTVRNVPDTRSSAASSAASSQPAASSAPAQSSQSSAPSKIVYTMPVSGAILTQFSGDEPTYDQTMGDWRVHDGVDIAGAQGTPVKACAAGTVTQVKVDDMLGQEVVIDHGNGIVSTYANLTNQVTVKQGQHVDAGDTIGCIGNTAQAEIALAPHLHFEISKNGVDVDPLAQISGQN
jgi:murein DD-endopeptidase MepM/ murein hydrolase activator NlpD